MEPKLKVEKKRIKKYLHNFPIFLKEKKIVAENITI